MDKKEDFGDEIIIADKEPEKYVFALLKSLQPSNFEKYKKIKIQATEANLPRAEYVIGLFTRLWVEEDKRERKTIKITKKNGDKYKLDVIEITLILHPKLRR